VDRNRLYRADCKIVAEQLKRENILVDLIYMDPPFNSNRTYSMIFNNRSVTAQQKAYHDMWDFTDRTRQLVMNFRDELRDWDLPDAFKQFMHAWLNILESGDADDRRLLNYLMYMTNRLIRLRDVLKPTGSIYLHCDSTASHYLKVIMDGVYGRRNFQNEVVWRRYDRPKGSQHRARRYGRSSDTILFYSKSDRHVFNADAIRRPLTAAEIAGRFPSTDDAGRYMSGPLLRSASMGERPNLVYEFQGYTPGPSGWRMEREKLQAVYDRGDFYFTSNGVPRRKFRPGEDPGAIIDNVWADIAPLGSQDQERLGFATQKPLTLLDRIVQASSNPGDLVLDPFCGCGTTVHAAETLGRRWIGVDISGDAVDEIKDRMADLGVYDGEHYDVHEGSPDTVAEYTRLNPFEKQDWLIRRLGGLPNPRKSGDHGIDGDLTFHLGGEDAASDQWGRLVFSVKTGKQRKPEHVRELIGTMRTEDAQIGVLILDADPTPGMESAAQRAGRLAYQSRTDLPPKTYERVQIFTAYEIMDGATLDCPPSMHDVRRYRELQTRMRI